MKRYFEIVFDDPQVDINDIYAVIVEKPECIYIKTNDGSKGFVKLPTGDRGIHFCLRNSTEYTQEAARNKIATDPDYSDLKE